MEWAKRELTQLQLAPPSPLTSAYDNIHTLISFVGGSSIATNVFGPTYHQRTRETLQRTFDEFLTTLEDSINSELQHSLLLFGLFESIDHQFINLARTVIRESSAQEHAQDDLL